MELLEAHREFKPTPHGPIDPDTVPQLTGKTDMGHGVTVYLVQDGAEGQKAMREILNAAYGKEFSPWCLLHGDGKGGLSSQAAHWWRHYSSLPKKVEFMDGKPIAFMATANTSRSDELGWAALHNDFGGKYEFARKREPGRWPTFDTWIYDAHPEQLEAYGIANEPVPEEWWDLNDKSHRTIAWTGAIPDDPLGRSGDVELGPADSIGPEEREQGGAPRFSLSSRYGLWDGAGPRWTGENYLVGIAATMILAGREKDLAQKLGQVAEGLQSELSPDDAVAKARELLRTEAADRARELVSQGRAKEAAQTSAMKRWAEAHRIKASGFAEFFQNYSFFFHDLTCTLFSLILPLVAARVSALRLARFHIHPPAPPCPTPLPVSMLLLDSIIPTVLAGARGITGCRNGASPSAAIAGGTPFPKRTRTCSPLSFPPTSPSRAKT